MTQKEKARSGVAAPKQAKQESRWDSDVSRFKCTIEPLRGQSTNRGWIVAPALLQGEEHALSTKELLATCGLRSPRELRAVIAREREEGALILSTCRHHGGYFLPAEGEAGRREIAAFVSTLHARAANTLKALRTAKAALEQMEGQLELGAVEWEDKPFLHFPIEPR